MEKFTGKRTHELFVIGGGSKAGISKIGITDCDKAIVVSLSDIELRVVSIIENYIAILDDQVGCFNDDPHYCVADFIVKDVLGELYKFGLSEKDIISLMDSDEEDALEYFSAVEG